MQADDTSKDDVPIKPDSKIDLISTLRKENFYFQTKIGELQSEIRNFHKLDDKYQKSIEKLKHANDEITDLKYRLQISINQNQENQKQVDIERISQNKIYINEVNNLKNSIKQLQKNKNTLLIENNQLKEKINSLSHKYDIDLSFFQNQNDILLSAAKSFFHISFSTVKELKEHLLNNSLPPLILPEKDRKIESQLIIINELKKKNKTMKKEYEAILNQKNSEINQLSLKIQNQQSTINDLNIQLTQKVDFFTRKISKIKDKVPKRKILHRFISNNINITPDPIKIPELNNYKENSNLLTSKLIENLNKTILQLQDENRRIHDESTNYLMEIQKLKSENDSKQNQISEYNLQLKSLKKKYQLKLKCANEKIKELQISSKIPDQLTENLISSAKRKIHQQRESIIYKDSQLSKLSDEINQLRLINSQQRIQIVRLEAEIPKPLENTSTQFFSDSPHNSFLSNHQQQNKITTNSFIFNYSDINPKLQSILRPILENQSLTIESKTQIAIKKIDSFYMEKLEKKKKYKEINYSIGNFISEILQLIIGRHIDAETLSKNTEFQLQAIEAIKENKRNLESLQSNVLSQKGEISSLNKKLTRSKEKLANHSIHQKKFELLKSDFDQILCENEKLKAENEDFERKITILKDENAELYSVLEYEKNHIIQIKKDQTNSLGEYEELLKKMKRKCCDQQKTIKCLSVCYC